MSELLEELRRLQDQISELPEPVSYIVLDHSWSMGLPHVDGHDAGGRRYILCSPAVLDGVRHMKCQPHNIQTLAPLFGVRIYKRASMPEGWPDADLSYPGG